MLEFNATIVIAIISFVVFMFLMNMILYKPMLEIVEKRRQLLDNNKEEAELNNQKADELATEKEQKLEEARFNSRKIIADILDEAKGEKAGIIAIAQQNAHECLNDTKAQLDDEAHHLKNAVKQDVVDIAQTIVTKVTGREIAITNVDDNKLNEVMNNGL